MDKLLKTRRDIIIKVLRSACYFPNEHSPHLSDVLTTDKEEQHFILARLGWEKDKHEYSVLFHIELKPNADIWIHENRTDTPIEDYLEELGIPSTKIKAAMWSSGVEDLAAAA